MFKKIIWVLAASFLFSCHQMPANTVDKPEPPKLPPSMVKKEEPKLYNSVNWQPFSPATFEHAKKENKVILLYVFNKDCGYCEEMDRKTFTNVEVATLLNDKYIPIRVDGDENPQILEVFEIQAYPTLVFLDSKGEFILSVEGYILPDNLLAGLTKLDKIMHGEGDEG